MQYSYMGSGMGIQSVLYDMFLFPFEVKPEQKMPRTHVRSEASMLP